jgi:hypothetical protein
MAWLFVVNERLWDAGVTYKAALEKGLLRVWWYDNRAADVDVVRWCYARGRKKKENAMISQFILFAVSVVFITRLLKEMNYSILSKLGSTLRGNHDFESTDPLDFELDQSDSDSDSLNFRNPMSKLDLPRSLISPLPDANSASTSTSDAETNSSISFRNKSLTYPGLANPSGNLCYLNAVLQSLASVPSFVRFLKHLVAEVEGMRDSKAKKCGGEVPKRLDELMTGEVSGANARFFLLSFRPTSSLSCQFFI